MSLLAFVIFNAVLLVAAAWDVRTFRIPNRLPLLLAVGALVAHPPAGATDALARLAAAAVVSVVCLGLYLRNVLGGGDVKLLIAAALWLSPSGLPAFAAALGAAGAMQGLATLALARLAPAARAAAPVAAHQMPYGVSIAAAGLFWSLLATFGR